MNHDHISPKVNSVFFHGGEIVWDTRLDERQMFVLSINMCVHDIFSKRKLVDLPNFPKFTGYKKLSKIRTLLEKKLN